MSALLAMTAGLLVVMTGHAESRRLIQIGGNGPKVRVASTPKLCPICRNTLSGEYYFDKCSNPGTLKQLVWSDMSPIAAHLYQSVDALKPTVTASCVRFIGGDTSGQFLAGSATYRFAWDGVHYTANTIIAAVSHPVTITRPWVYFQSSYAFGYESMLHYCTYPGRGLGAYNPNFIIRNSGIYSNSNHIYIYIRNTGTNLMECYEDGVAIGSTTGAINAGNASSSHNIWIGGNCYAANSFQYFDTVNIGGILTWDSVLSPADQYAAMKYLKARVKW